MDVGSPSALACALSVPVVLRAEFSFFSQAQGFATFQLVHGSLGPICGIDDEDFIAKPQSLEEFLSQDDRELLEFTMAEMAGLVAPLPRSIQLRWRGVGEEPHWHHSVATIVSSLREVANDTRSFEVLVRWSSSAQEVQKSSVSPAFTQDSYFFEKVVEMVNDGILVNAPDGTILFMNDNLAGLLGYSPRELLGMHLFDLMDEEGIQLTRERLGRRREGVEEAFDFRFVHREGHSVWTRVAAKPFHDERGGHRGSLVAISDISERKRAEFDLQELLQELEQRVAERTKEIELSNRQLQSEIEVRKEAEFLANAANAAKSTFLANMSHELRTPLTAILGYSQLLEEELADEGPSAHLQDLQKIQSAGRHLLQLISDILDLSKIEAGKLELHIEPVLLPEFLTDVEALASELCAHNDNGFGLDADDAPALLETDRLKLRQILLNFLGNAAKFTERGEVSLRVYAHEHEGVPHCVFAVSDTGIGIEPHALRTLFQPFQQADNRPSRRYQGAGLGLSISHEFAKALGGFIHVESTPGVGSLFSISLPNTTMDKHSSR